MTDTTPASWNTGSGDWFVAGNWDENNPSPPPNPIHFVPDAGNDVTISNVNNVQSFMVSFSGSDSVATLNSSATVDITGGALELINQDIVGGVAHDAGSVTAGINVASGSGLTVDHNTLIAQSGNFAGTVAGAGAIFFDVGTFNINAGANFTIAGWTIGSNASGFGATVVLNTDLAYADTFAAVDTSGNSPTINLNSHTLTLSSVSNLLDGIFSGPGTLKITGFATEPGQEFGSNTMIGGAVLEVGSGAIVTQVNSLNLGNANGTGTLHVGLGGLYQIEGSSNLGTSGPAGNAFVTNDGTVQITGSAITPTSDAHFTNNETLTVDDGNTFTMAGDNTLGGTLNGTGKLVLGAGTTALNSTAVSVGTLALAGGNGGAFVTLGGDLVYAGALEFDGQFDEFTLAGHTLTLTGSANKMDTAVLDGGGKLLVSGGSLDVGGNFNAGGPNGVGTAVTIEDEGGITQSGNIGLHGTLQIDINGEYDLNAGNIASLGTGGANITNSGLLRASPVGNSTISGNYSGAGEVLIAAGGVLTFNSGTENFGSGVTIAGGGELVFGFAANATIGTPFDFSVAKFALAGGNGGATVTLADPFTYAGVFEFDGQFDTLLLTGGTLTLTGTQNSLHGNVIDGGGGIFIASGGAADIGGNLNVGGANGNGVGASIEDGGTITQSGGIGVNGSLTIDANATYTITSASNITGLGSLSLQLANNGMLEDSASGRSTISGPLLANGPGGTMQVDSGATLVLAGSFGNSGTLSGAGTLVFGAGTTTINSSSSVTVSELDINGGLGGNTTNLGANLEYDGTFKFVGEFDTLAINARTLTLDGAATLTGGVITGTGGGTIKINGTAQLATNIGTGQALDFVTVEDAGEIDQIGNFSLAGTLMIDLGSTYTMSSAHFVNNNASFNNSGALVAVSGANQIDGSIANTGTIDVDAGASLRITGNLTGGGNILTIHDHGRLEIDGNDTRSNVFFATGIEETLAIGTMTTADIHGLAVSDAIVFTSLAPQAGDHLAFDGTTLSVLDSNGSTRESLVLATSLAADQFVLENDGNNHLKVVVTAPGGLDHSDMNGDGISDLVFQSHSTVDTLYASMPSGILVDDIFPALTGVDATQIRAAGSGDVDGNGTADVVFQIGDDIVSKAAGDIASTFGPMVFAVPDGWTVSGVGDVNGDGAADILITDATNDAGRGNTFFIDAKASFATIASGTPHEVAGNLATPGANYVVRGVGDINGDGVNDVVFQNTADGDVIYADMKAVAQHVAANNFSLNDTLHQILSTSVINASLVVKAVGDLDGDGLADLVVEQESDPNAGPVHSLVLEAHNGGGNSFTFQTAGSITDYGAFDVKGIADVNGDGIGDILMQYTQDLPFGPGGAANLHGGVIVVDPAHGATAASIALVTQTVGLGASGADYVLV